MQNDAAEHTVPKTDRTGPLLEGGEHFDALVSGVEDYAIFLLSSKGHIISWNKGAERIKGYKQEEVIGKHYSIFYPPEARERDRRRHDPACRSAGRQVRG